MDVGLNGLDFRDIVSGKKRGLVASFIRAGLGAAEIPYTLAVNVRNRRFDRDTTRVHRVSVPVVSVGNLTLGGTGKTPLVAFIAKWFLKRRIRPAIVSRGYGGDGSHNDEAMELAARLPNVSHLQNPDRVSAANQATKEHEAQVIILDDGFQHRRIHRDLDIVLVDATEPYGFDHVFPRGTLREPLTGIRRADVAVITRSDLVVEDERAAIIRRYSDICPSLKWIMTAHEPSHLLSSDGSQEPLRNLDGKRIAAFCGIGNPQAFRHSLSNLRCDVAAFREFPDHHHFTTHDTKNISTWASEASVDFVICTHKDLVKIQAEELGGVPLRAISIDLAVCSGLDLLERELAKIASKVRH